MAISHVWKGVFGPGLKALSEAPVQVVVRTVHFKKLIDAGNVVIQLSAAADLGHPALCAKRFVAGNLCHPALCANFPKAL